MECTVREAAAGEEEEIVPLYEWLFAAPGTRPAGWDPEWAARALKTAIEDPNSVVFVAQEEGEGELLGLCSAYIDLPSVRYGERCWVEDLTVDPDCRSAGIGSRLLDAAEAWGRGKGATHLELDTGIARVDSQLFYEARGPVTTSICYQWRLDSPGP
ncbi:MAG: GNAT family N-acetyltransferase [Solirubrobacterales bacterium]|nr:GNAT family N-acetyltransferase [Solirubrobacterales bacterium]